MYRIPPDLPAFSWMRDARVIAVISALEAAAPDCVRFVGGCVRDSLLNGFATGKDVRRKNALGDGALGNNALGDIDLATTLTPQAVMAALEAKNINHTPTGIDHGTITAHRAGLSLEVTTLRADIETDGRHATVTFGENWTADAQRRDFTINALYLTPDGAVHDPVGGLADLHHKSVRFIGTPARRIREDYLRILRFFRFSARFGPDPDPDGLAAVTAHAAGLRHISRERIRDEILKTISAPHAPDILTKMRDTGVFGEIMMGNPSIDDFRRAHHLVATLDTGQETSPAPPLDSSRNAPVNASFAAPGVLLLAGLLPHVSAQDLMEKLCLSRKACNRIKNARAMAAEFGFPADRAMFAALHHYAGGAAHAADALLLSATRAPHEGQPGDDTARFAEGLKTLASLPLQTFPVKGGDVVAIAAENGTSIGGAALGTALREIERAWVGSGFPQDASAITGLIELALKPKPL